MYSQLALIFISRKQREKILGTIIYLVTPLAVNVDAYQRRNNNSDTAGKGYKRNPTTDEQFISKALLCSILSVVEESSLIIK